MNKFIRQNFAGLSLLKGLYLGPLEDDFAKT